MNFTTALIGFVIGLLITLSDEFARMMRPRIGFERGVGLWATLALAIVVNTFLYARESLILALLVAVLTTMVIAHYRKAATGMPEQENGSAE